MKVRRKWISSLIVTVLVITSVFSGGEFNQTAKAGVTLYWPVPGHTNRSQGLHNKNAIDISDASIAGATVVAAIGGTVTYKFTCGSQHYGSTGDCNGFGTGLVIAGTDGRTYQYAHMQAGSIPGNIVKGSTVSGGQMIGRVGTTGNSSGNHLHFGICYGNYWSGTGNPDNESYINVPPDGNQPPVSNVTFQDQNINKVEETNAEVYVKIMNPNKANCESVGCNLFDENNNLLKTYTENCNLSTSYINYNCNFNNDMHYTLNPGTVYKYELFATVGGQQYKDSVRTFKTNGVSDTQKPVISDVSVTEFDGYGYEIMCKVTDNEKVAKVQFPTWTEQNGGDDLFDDWGNSEKARGILKEDGYYHYRVNIGEHNNESGNYLTHIYAYDEAGNKEIYHVPTVVIPKYTLQFVERSPLWAVQGKDASIISAEIKSLEDKDMTFASLRFVTQVNKDGKIEKMEKDYGTVTIKARQMHCYEYIIDRSDFGNATGIYTTTCYLVDADGNEQSVVVNMDFSGYKDNCYARVQEGEVVDLEEASGIPKGYSKYSLMEYLQPDISEYLTIAEEENNTTKFLCKKAGRVYVVWINLSTAERNLQIVDIVAKEDGKSTTTPKATVEPTPTMRVTATPKATEEPTPTMKVTATPTVTAKPPVATEPIQTVPAKETNLPATTMPTPASGAAVNPTPTNAWTDVISDTAYSYEQNKDGKTITITKCSSTAVVIDIPSSIDGYTVTQIGDKAFENMTSMKVVTFPSELTSIGNYAFAGCSSLTSVTLPDSLTGLGIYVFKDCTSLTSAVLNEGRVNVVTGLFQGCTALSSVTIKDKVQYIRENAFDGCTALKTLNLPKSLLCIEKNAFLNSGITSITYEGTSADWKKIKIDFIGNNSLQNAVVITSTGDTITAKPVSTPIPEPTQKPAAVTKPAKVNLKSVKALGKKKLKVTWEWDVKASGYQVQYALNANFTKEKKTKNAGEYDETKTLTGLKAKKYYYVRVRAYKKSGGKTVYGSWSTVKKCKVK